MPLLVHIAPENQAGAIRRNGIAPRRWKRDPKGDSNWDRGVWAFPVLPSYTLTLSWARELKRSGQTALATITFRLRDTEMVYARHFSAKPQPMTAAEAAGLILAAADPRGYEIIIPRRILPGEIVRVQSLPRAIGWRYYPNAKGKPMPTCDCPMCLPRGEVNAKRHREQVLAKIRAAGLLATQEIEPGYQALPGEQ